LIDRWASADDRADIAPGRRAGSSLLARAALRALLAKNTGRTDWQIVRSPLGKPFVVTPSGSPGPAISLSHAGATVAVAMAEVGALGIDIEQHRPRDFAAIAAQAFGSAERAEVAASGTAAFYRIWTLREAMAKATGEGLGLAANGCDLVAGHADDSYRRTECEGRVWRLAHVRLQPACSLAVAHADATYGAWAPRWDDLGGV
jgi:4'-phosphopantetheinyl transferase